MIYLAATAIDAMCTRRGMSGVVSHLGESCEKGRLHVKRFSVDVFPGSDGSLMVSISDHNPRGEMVAVV